ncbi:hypothetical protein PENSOL_c006G00501 [Penicillium solitum]|uniref:Uncharacterized protein n=1 Tax=Penicillium solitum TaxID=60172 RepID=A0A1V6RDP4_9EURO|nr:uncharacterized protein PENSOL_c006G00501 [Penicillium solitum]OQD99423.1 hypothetical protein PENSOL_c006G00501 [Penicillium solitum]
MASVMRSHPSSFNLALGPMENLDYSMKLFADTIEFLALLGVKDVRAAVVAL